MMVLYARHVLQLPSTGNEEIQVAQEAAILCLRAMLESPTLGPLMVDKSGHALVLGDGNPRAPLGVHILSLLVSAARVHARHAVSQAQASETECEWPRVVVRHCMDSVLRVLCLLRRFKVRIELAWPQLVHDLLDTVQTMSFVTTAAGAAAGRAVAPSLGAIVWILNYIVQHGADFLPSSLVYDKVFLALTTSRAQDVEAIPGLSRACGSAVRSVPGLAPDLVFNLLQIVDHYRDHMAARKTKSEDQGLAVIQAHFGTLVLSLDTQLSTFARWTPESGSSFLSSVVAIVVQHKMAR